MTAARARAWRSRRLWRSARSPFTQSPTRTPSKPTMAPIPAPATGALIAAITARVRGRSDSAVFEDARRPSPPSATDYRPGTEPRNAHGSERDLRAQAVRRQSAIAPSRDRLGPTCTASRLPNGGANRAGRRRELQGWYAPTRSRRALGAPRCDRLHQRETDSAGPPRRTRAQASSPGSWRRFRAGSDRRHRRPAGRRAYGQADGSNSCSARPGPLRRLGDAKRRCHRAGVLSTQTTVHLLFLAGKDRLDLCSEERGQVSP